MNVKILVAVKRVLDPCVVVRVKSDASGVDVTNVRMSMNPFDEIAIEAALRLKESGIASEVVAISCGPSSCQETLRVALAMGADRAVLVETAAEVSPLNVAKLLKTLCEREQAGLVICGKQAVDNDANQTGQMLAALLAWPQATFASELRVADGKVCIVRDVDGGRETLQVSLPAVVTTELGLNEPRYATLPNIMKARKKPLEVTSPEALGVALSARVSVVEVIEPPKRRTGVLVSDVAALVEKLRAEANVLGGREL